MAVETRRERPTVGDVPRYVGWSAILSAIAAALGFIAFGVFMAVGGYFSTVADLSGIVLGLSVLPVAWGMHLLYRTRPNWGNQIVLVAGLLGGGILCVTSLGLVLEVQGLGVSVARLESSGTIGSGVVGVWLLGVSLLEFGEELLGRRLLIIGVAAGIGYVTLTFGFLFFSFEHPVTTLGGFVGVVAYIGWAILLGRRFLSDGSADPVESP